MKNPGRSDADDTTVIDISQRCGHLKAKGVFMWP